MNWLLAVDLFATKGLEYLLVIAFLVVFIFFLRALFVGARKRRGRAGKDDHDEER